jgi:ABC-type lipopolysaccharide export system ATPase subunit
MTGPSSGPAVAARGLVCQFGPVRAVDDLSFEVAEGEVFGLLSIDGQPTGLAHYRDHGIPKAIRSDIAVMRKPR